MQKAIISIVYHSSSGHMVQLAQLIGAHLRSEETEVHVLTDAEAERNFSLLHASDAIVFGCPTHFGNVSAAFQRFMESTGNFWYRQLWKNKLAAGFTISSTSGGDKLNTLQSLILFACQHGMNWISLGVLPRFINDEQTDGQNRLASYAGLMAQCSNNCRDSDPLHPGDQLTAELFAQRIVQLVLNYKQGQAINSSTIHSS